MAAAGSAGAAVAGLATSSHVRAERKRADDLASAVVRAVPPFAARRARLLLVGQRRVRGLERHFTRNHHRDTMYTIRMYGKNHVLTYEQAFQLGHSLIEGGRAQDAAFIFAMLAQSPGNGPRAQIMLARCEAAMDSFTACREALATVFADDQKPLADELQRAFVFAELGLRDDALRAVLGLANRYPQYPTLCLILGDMFRANGNDSKAKECWKLAGQRDRQRGSVALAAKRQLERLTKPRRKPDVEKRNGRKPAEP